MFFLRHIQSSSFYEETLAGVDQLTYRHVTGNLSQKVLKGLPNFDGNDFIFVKL